MVILKNRILASFWVHFAGFFSHFNSGENRFFPWDGQSFVCGSDCFPCFGFTILCSV